MGVTGRPRKRLDINLPVAYRHYVARRDRLDALGRETEIQQGHALAGRRHQRPLDRVAQRLDAQRIAGHHHVAQGVEKHQAIGPVELAGQMAANVHQRRLPVGRKRAAKLVHQDFRVRLARQVIVVVVQKLLAQVPIVGQLPVEGEAEPLVLLDVVPLEGLGRAAVVLAAGGVADVADRRPAGVVLHQALELAAMAQAKDLAHVAQVLVGVDQLVSAGRVGRDAGRQLAAVLNVQQHPRHQPGNLLRPLLGAQRAYAPIGQMIDRRYAAFLAKLAHR